jgi:protein tyrosine phosphatase (PTP) superfamily phosphohydrolase (DUF442 family)
MLASTIKSGGKIVLAGLLERQQEEVREAYATWFTSEPDQVKEGWMRLAGVCRIPSLINFLHVSDSIATAGQPQAAHFPLLSRAGYKTVINLAAPSSPNFMADEAAQCAQHGMHYEHLPVVWTQPTREDLERFMTAMKARGDQKTFVHCALNKRVSVFVFLYRVIGLGETVEVASQELQQIWAPNEVWSKYMHNMLHAFKPEQKIS